LREAIGATIYLVYRDSYDRAVARAVLGEPALRTAWTQGQFMTPQEALSAQEQEMTPTATTVGSPPMMKFSPSLFELTAREVEVLRLLALGWTNAQIAQHLVVSVRTVNRHTTSLYSKLGFSSRAAATCAAMDHHLL
jgi:DNA-binding NarL/FixJ family response regulator